MTRACFSLCVGLLLATSAPLQAGAPSPAGTWKLTYVVAGATESAAVILKLDSRGDKVTGELVAGNPRITNVALKSVSLKGNTLVVVLQYGTVEMTFEGVVAAGRMPGSLSAGSILYPAWLAATAETTLDAKSLTRSVDCPPMLQARALSLKANTLRFKAFQTKDAEQKKGLLKQAAEADVEAKKETPKLYREVLAKHADSVAVVEAGLNLIRNVKANGAMADEVKSWAEAAGKKAKAYGSRFQADFASQVAAAVADQRGLAPLAVEFARQAEQSLTEHSSAEVQARVLGMLARVLHKNGQGDDAKLVEARLEKVEVILDREYLARMPPFKASPFAGRKGKSDRAVFLELFTGATCPPCVAADIAFDVLARTYKPAELVLIQYHMHIPRADTLTNPDSEARWAYYGKAFPGQVRGVPASIFNGKPQASGGGGLTYAEKKYETYRQVIDPLLEEPAGARLTAQAIRKGDEIDIHVDVNDLNGADALKKLRILLVEETIRYAGSNSIRFHHNVVRAFPGGVAGQPLMAKSSKHKASVDLGQLRGSLNKYLDNYQANFAAFPNPARPLDFENLRVIAFVQDDSTSEILQVVQVEVEGTGKGK